MKKMNSNERPIEVDVSIRRIVIILIAFVISLCFVGYYRVYRIKADGDKYETAAIKNQMNKVQDKVVAANRGDIVDRNGEILAVGESVFNIILDVRLLVEQEEYFEEYNLKLKPDKRFYPVDETFTAIHEILEIPMETLDDYISTDEKGQLKYDKNYLIIAKKVSYDRGKKINDLKFSWIYGEQDTQRVYPQSSLAAQIIGFQRGESFWGLEGYYNNEMTGIPGRTFRTFESDGYAVTQRENPIQGNKLVTTLDINLQRFAEEACKVTYDAYIPEYTSTIIANPNTMEIFAMAQYPTFDLNEPMNLTDVQTDAEKEIFDSLAPEDQSLLATKAWKNFNITETYEPGSIYKPMMVAMALEEGIIKPTDTFVCGGYKRIADHDIYCHLKTGHGTLDVKGALAQSCNVAMMDIIAKMDKLVYLKYQQDFGFGEKTGIDLYGEANAASLIYTEKDLNAAEKATSSFGQGFNCTTLQVLNAFAATINGGKLMRPYVVSQVLDEGGKVIEEMGPTVVREVISKDTSDWIRQSLEDTFTVGTGKKAAIESYRLGGKTGTAQQAPRSEQKYTLSFVAYHSVDNPDIIAITVIHKPMYYDDNGGDATPVPALKKLFEDIIDYETLPPDDEDGTRIDALTDTFTVKDYTNTNLNETIGELINQGIDFEVIGSGDTITKQSPAGGTKLTKKPTKILLNIKALGENELITIPDVIGLSVEDAVEMLQSAGFKTDVTEEKEEIITEEETTTQTTTREQSINAALSRLMTTQAEINTEKTTQDDKRIVEKVEEKTVYVQMPSSGIKVESGITVKIRAK